MIGLVSTLIPTRRHRRRADARGVLTTLTTAGLFVLGALAIVAALLRWAP